MRENANTLIERLSLPIERTLSYSIDAITIYQFHGVRLFVVVLCV